MLIFVRFDVGLCLVMDIVRDIVSNLWMLLSAIFDVEVYFFYVLTYIEKRPRVLERLYN